MGKNVLFQFKYIAAFKMEEPVALFAFHMDTVRMTAEAAGIFVTGACIFIYNEFFHFAAGNQVFQLSVDRSLSHGSPIALKWS